MGKRFALIVLGSDWFGCWEEHQEHEKYMILETVSNSKNKSLHRDVSEGVFKPNERMCRYPSSSLPLNSIAKTTKFSKQ